MRLWRRKSDPMDTGWMDEPIHAVSVFHLEIIDDKVTPNQVEAIEERLLDVLHDLGIEWFAWGHYGDCAKDSHGAHWCKPPADPCGCDVSAGVCCHDSDHCYCAEEGHL